VLTGIYKRTSISEHNSQCTFPLHRFVAPRIKIISTKCCCFSFFWRTHCL